MAGHMLTVEHMPVTTIYSYLHALSDHYIAHKQLH